MVELSDLSLSDLVSYIKSNPAGTIANYCAVIELCKRADQIIKGKTNEQHTSPSRKKTIQSGKK